MRITMVLQKWHLGAQKKKYLREYYQKLGGGGWEAVESSRMCSVPMSFLV